MVMVVFCPVTLLSYSENVNAHGRGLKVKCQNVCFEILCDRFSKDFVGHRCKLATSGGGVGDFTLKYVSLRVSLSRHMVHGEALRFSPQQDGLWARFDDIACACMLS